MVAFDHTGNAVQRFQENENLFGHHQIRTFFKIAGRIIVIQLDTVGNRQGSKPYKIRVDPV